ncbi:rRNA maturation RNase YbeY [Uliginosibacterium sp. TH139]|jgi:probable rRNA maturation factor|uniref:rRNA maturation RNase YbeY n=1 Tax=Uliginosibacterium sp. TH139 TaxID=2067453 RepID=UPI000C7AE140|nr:rRNA maturation RNase YbeY [Uliginosibacterium sp. TH139]PLK49166.1 rRNA maturation RNase YbeY [Uliginosibacterium sp. TH139]
MSGIPRRLNLSVQYALSAEGLPERSQLRGWIRAAEPGAAQLTVRFVDREEGRGLNAEYRGKDYATNVLSFPYEQEPILTGDLVLCWPVVVEEAAAQGKPVEAHCAHLIVHGVLHLQGWEHEEDAEAEEMEQEERTILAELGYPDPYANEEK